MSLGTPYRHSRSIAYLKKHLQVPFYLLQDENKIKLAPPTLNVPVIPKIYQEVSERKTPLQFIIRLDKGRAWGRNGAVITKENVFLYELSREFGIKKHFSEHSIYHSIFFKRSEYFDKKIALVTTAGADVYYHWMLDILPRILLLKKAGLFTDIEAFIINYKNLPFQKETLRLLNINESEIIKCNNKGFHVTAKQLFVPSLVSQLNKVNKYEINLLRKHFLVKDLTFKGFPRIYISRRKANTRTVINEDELINYLKKLNFEILEMEEFTVSTQIQLFQRAKIIIGPHGSAFTNLVFSNPGTLFIELIPDTNIVPCFYNIAAQLYIKYYGFISKGVPINNSCKNDNIQIDLSSFISFVEPILNNIKISVELSLND